MTYRDINPRDERMQCLTITPVTLVADVWHRVNRRLSWTPVGVTTVDPLRDAGETTGQYSMPVRIASVNRFSSAARRLAR